MLNNKEPKKASASNCLIFMCAAAVYGNMWDGNKAEIKTKKRTIQVSQCFCIIDLSDGKFTKMENLNCMQMLVIEACICEKHLLSRCLEETAP